MKTIAIIGGGAAGLAAAIAAAEQVVPTGSNPPHTQIVVYEREDRVGKSILVTGNGRCNFSNSALDPMVYYNHDFVREAMAALPPHEVLAWFSDKGLMWAEEGGGRLFPLSKRANTVLDILRLTMKDKGIIERTNTSVQAITPLENRFLLSLDADKTAWADAVILACGKHVARSLLPPEHRFENTDPMSCPLKTGREAIKGLNNIRAQVEVEVGGFREQGELLFRDYGVSGIVIFNASRFSRTNDILTIDFVPDKTHEELTNFIRGLSRTYPTRSTHELFRGLFHPRIIESIGRQAHVAKTAGSDEETIDRFVQAAKCFKLTVVGKGDSKQAMVYRGGFCIEGFDSQTMQSRYNPRLFVVGEALDVDAPCGGYNLHWAWTSGIIAGRSAISCVHGSV